MRISDWSSDVCSSDLRILELGEPGIIVRDADGEVRGTLFEEARHALGGIGAAPAREGRAAGPAVRAHWVRRAQHPTEHVAGAGDRSWRAVLRSGERREG